MEGINLLLVGWYIGLVLFGLLGINIYWLQAVRTAQREEAHQLHYLYSKLRIKRKISRRFIR